MEEALAELDAHHFTLSDGGVALDRLLAARLQLTQRIIASQAPMRWLPTLTQRWRGLLALASESSEPAEAVAWEPLALEFLALAQVLRSMGEIAAARESLGRCIALARRHRISDSVIDRAKRELRTCIKLQEALAECRSLLRRTKSPPQITAFLTRELSALSAQTPFSLEIAMLRAELQWAARQFAPLVRSLSESPLTPSSARLTLLLARALDALGEYQRSLDAIARGGDWSDGSSCEPATQTSDQEATASVRALRERLVALLDGKRSAEQLLRETRFADAEQRFSHCLALLGDRDNSDNRGRDKFRASLLFGRASATLLLIEALPAAAMPAKTTRFAAATDDLTRVLELDAANRLAKLRLDTATMQHETETLRAKLGGGA